MRRAGVQWSPPASSAGSLAGPVDVYLYGPKYCPQDVPKSAPRITEAQAIERTTNDAARRLLRADRSSSPAARTTSRTNTTRGVSMFTSTRTWAGRQDKGGLQAHLPHTGRGGQLPRAHSRHRIRSVELKQCVVRRHSSLVACVACAAQARRRSTACARSCATRRPRARSSRRPSPTRAGASRRPRRGEFLLERPGKFRWTVAKPYKQLLVGDGQRVWIFDEDLNQVIVRKIGERWARRPPRCLSGNQDVERAFTWKDLPIVGRARVAVGDADLEGDDVRRNPARASTPRASRRSSSSMRSARRASCVSRASSAIRSSRRRSFQLHAAARART